RPPLEIRPRLVGTGVDSGLSIRRRPRRRPGADLQPPGAVRLDGGGRSGIRHKARVVIRGGGSGERRGCGREGELHDVGHGERRARVDRAAPVGHRRAAALRRGTLGKHGERERQCQVPERSRAADHGADVHTLMNDPERVPLALCSTHPPLIESLRTVPRCRRADGSRKASKSTRTVSATGTKTPLTTPVNRCGCPWASSCVTPTVPPNSWPHWLVTASTPLKGLAPVSVAV